MAIAFVTADSVNSSSNVTLLSGTASGISGSQLVGYLCVSSGGVPSAPTWNGVSMGAAIATQASWFGDTLYIYRLANPANGTVEVTGMPSAPHSLSWIVLSGTDQTTFNRTVVGASGAAADSSVAATSVADDWVVDFLYIGGTITASVGAGQTLRASNAGVNGNDGRMYASTETATGVSTTMSWTHAFANRTLVALAVIPGGASAAITGTITDPPLHRYTFAEDGGKTIIITLTGDTWVAAGATFDAIRQDIINGLDAADATANGWNEVIRDTMPVTAVVRTSATVVTITLPVFPTYAPAATQTITVTVPASAVTLASPITATPTFTTYRGPVPSITSGSANGSGVLTFTISNDDPNTANGEYTETTVTVGGITARTSNRFS